MNKKKVNRNAAKTARYRFAGSIYALTGLAVAVSLPQPLLAQVVPAPSDDVTVTSDSSTWLQETAVNAITIPTGADGVTINNSVGGVITSANATAIETSADTTINNDGTVAGGFNGVDFVNGAGSGSLTNGATGVISSDSRAVNIGGSVQVTNQGQILGTGNQRNGTIYADGVADNFSFDNQTGGVLDAGVGNTGSGFGAEVGQAADGANTFSLTNAGTIAGRGSASAATAAAGDGVRIGNPGDSGVSDASIVNSGSITSESNNGTTAGIRAVDGVGFQGTLDNTGAVSGAQNGVYFGDADHTGGVVNNSGDITSDSRAFNIDGTGLEVNNSGNIVGTGDQRNGTVYADGTADDFSFNNQAGGVIDAGAGNTGSGFGAEIGSAADGANTFSLTNDGTIAGRGSASAATNAAGDGVRIGNPGNTGVTDATIVNNGSITSESTDGTTAGIRAVDGVGFQGKLDNVGTVSGVQNGLYFGNGDHTGGVVNNSGSITSDSRALNIDGTGLEVNNSGDITGTGDQRNGTAYADSTAQDFTLNNTGSIDAGAGNQGAAFSAELSGSGNNFTIDNSGTLEGRGNAGAGSTLAGDGIRLERTRVNGALDASTTGLFTGEINNTGTITSEGANGTVGGFRAVNGVSFQGELNNAGTISGTQNGVYFGNAVGAGGADHTGGVVNNSGNITSDSRALNIDGTGLEVNNSGDITGTGDQRNGTAYADSTAQDFTLNNTGSIDAGAGNQGAAFSAELSGAGNNFTIDNSGTLEGRGNAGAGSTLAGDGIRLERTRVNGALDASTTGLFTGEINNTGTITSEGANGTVGGFRAVNGVSFQGELNNAGTISGTQNGVYFGNAVGAGGADHTGGVVNNSGNITSDSRALNIDGTGLEVNNSGNILGTGDQRNGTVYADSTAQDFTLNNTGTVDAGAGNQGAGFSAELSATGNNFTIDNLGSIEGRGDAGAGSALAGDGIRLERTRVGGALDATTTGLFTGTINNSGAITSEGANGTVGGFRAVNGVSFQGELNNSGTISGTQNGVYFGNAVAAGGADHTNGVVNNSGVISSDSRAVNIDGNGLTLNNTGNILATGRQRNGTVYADGTADNFTIFNEGSIDARGGAGSGISVQVGSFAGDVQNGRIENSGQIFGFGNDPLDAGIRLFSNDADTVFSGDIINNNRASISGGSNSAAVLFGSEVQFDGVLDNAGVIDGSIFLSDGDLLLRDTSELFLDINSLTDFEVFETTGDLFADGTLNLSFDSFIPTIGQTFDLFDFGFASGGFDFIQADGFLLDTSDLLVGGSVTVVGAAVPEPSTFVVLGFAGLMLAGRRRRSV